MSSLIHTANKLLLTPAELDNNTLSEVVSRAMGKQIDYADVYLQCSQEESWTLEDSIVKSGHFVIDRGFGLRVISGSKTGFAFADGIDKKSLFNAASNAKRIATSGGSQSIHLHCAELPSTLYPDLNPLQTIRDDEKVKLIHQVEDYARSLDPRVSQVFVSLSGQYDVITLFNSDEQLVADVRPLVSLRISVVVEQGSRREKGFCGGGGRHGYEIFLNPSIQKQYAERAVKQALTSLNAKPAPAGLMTVVLGPGWPAVLLHEAIGHGLEGDFNRKGTSAFTGRMHQQVASKLCTILDDGTIPGKRGSLSVDDEGVSTKKTVLIENGILKNYMMDKHNAKLMGTTSTGNGRRESYAHCPLPRMTNTYMLPGQSEPDEIIQSVKQGIYAVDFAGGQVDITSGKFVFSMSEAYLIENGKVTSPIKGATLIGNGPDILTRVSMVGNNLALDQGIGTCGKDGQTVPVGVGQPTIKVDEITVGGSH